jgi:hypothetical protein
MRKGDWDKDKLKNPGKQMRSVWYISSTPKSEKKYGKHPTRKPLSLLNRVILASTNKGDLTTLKINKNLPARNHGRGVLPYAQNNNNSVWQRNYWEHIIRTEIEYTKISQYIINNPLCWDNDKLNGGYGNTVLEDEIDYNLELWMV